MRRPLKTLRRFVAVKRKSSLKFLQYLAVHKKLIPTHGDNAGWLRIYRARLAVLNDPGIPHKQKLIAFSRNTLGANNIIKQAESTGLLNNGTLLSQSNHRIAFRRLLEAERKHIRQRIEELSS
ncbi:MAG: hypothetical protein V1776_01470 [Candidatus Diapherotrites archaeon]